GATSTIFAEGLPAPADASLVRPIVSRHLGVLRNAGAIQGAIAALLPLAEGTGPVADPGMGAARFHPQAGKDGDQQRDDGRIG
ncbi:hypothetical protein ACC709_36890, partial [Rhizobium ruizarguesonis]